MISISDMSNYIKIIELVNEQLSLLLVQRRYEGIGELKEHAIVNVSCQIL